MFAVCQELPCFTYLTYLHCFKKCSWLCSAAKSMFTAEKWHCCGWHVPVTKAVYHRVKPHGFPCVTTCYNTSNCGIKYHPAISLSSFGFQNSKPEEIGAMPLVYQRCPASFGIHSPQDWALLRRKQLRLLSTLWRGKDNDVTRVELAVANHAEIIQTYSNTKQWSWSFFLTSARSFKPVSFSPWFVCSATWSVPGLEQLCPELDAVWPPIFWSPSQLAPWDWTTCWSKGQYTALKNRLSSLAADFFQFLTNALSLAGHLANLTKSFRCKWPAGLGSARCRFPWKPPGESSSVFF